MMQRVSRFQEKLFLIHPVFFAVLPTLVLYVQNMHETWPSVMIWPLIHSLVLAIISWLVFFLFFRNREKASLMDSVWLVAFFSYGHLYLLVTGLGLTKLIPLGPNLVLLSVYFAALLLIFVVLWKTHQPLHRALVFFTVVGVIVLASNLISIVPFEVQSLLAFRRLRAHEATDHIIDAPITNADVSTYPNIYYFIFEDYGNEKILKQYLNRDISDFVNDLRQKNFFVADDSVANYPTSFQSLSSSLNMMHITYLQDVLGKDYPGQAVVYSELLDQNNVVQFLKRLGYTFIQFGSSWGPATKSSLADENYNLFLNFNELESLLYENTILNTVVGKLGQQQIYTGVDLLTRQGENFTYKINLLARTTSNLDPQFIFAHFMVPHQPYLLNSTCQQKSFEEVRQRWGEVGFLDQVDCVNKEMERLSDIILQKATRPTVIIFQTDEGPNLPSHYFNDRQYIDTPNHDAFKIHAHILNAFYLPDKNNPSKAADYAAVGITNTETPVNTFRLIFNYYFGSQFKLLEDRSFIYTDDNHPYQFIEITNLIKD